MCDFGKIGQHIIEIMAVAVKNSDFIVFLIRQNVSMATNGNAMLHCGLTSLASWQQVSTCQLWKDPE